MIILPHSMPSHHSDLHYWNSHFLFKFHIHFTYKNVQPIEFQNELFTYYLCTELTGKRSKNFNMVIHQVSMWPAKKQSARHGSHSYNYDPQNIKRKGPAPRSLLCFTLILELLALNIGGGRTSSHDIMRSPPPSPLTFLLVIIAAALVPRAKLWWLEDKKQLFKKIYQSFTNYFFILPN